jgi:hypothetical protein
MADKKYSKNKKHRTNERTEDDLYIDRKKKHKEFKRKKQMLREEDFILEEDDYEVYRRNK